MFLDNDELENPHVPLFCEIFKLRMPIQSYQGLFQLVHCHIEYQLEYCNQPWIDTNQWCLQAKNQSSLFSLQLNGFLKMDFKYHTKLIVDPSSVIQPYKFP